MGICVLSPVSAAWGEIPLHAGRDDARDDRPGILFGGERASGLDFATASISVPSTHVKSHVEWPRPQSGDLRTDFVASVSSYLGGEKAFAESAVRELANRPPGKRRVIVFVHGYNIMFAEELYRFAQIVDDSGATSVPVHFNWASRGKLAGYDNNSATAARDGLDAASSITILASLNE